MDTLETQAGGTELVTAAGIEKKEIEAVDTMESMLEGQEIGLRKSYADIGADYEKSLSEYQNKLKQVGLQKDLAQQQSEQWYLGKNVGRLNRWLPFGIGGSKFITGGASFHFGSQKGPG